MNQRVIQIKNQHQFLVVKELIHLFLDKLGGAIRSNKYISAQPQQRILSILYIILATSTMYFEMRQGFVALLTD